MILLLKKLHARLLIVSMGFFFFLLYPPLYYSSLEPKRYPGMIKLRKAWAYLSAAAAGVFFRFEFEEPIDWSKTYVITPLHTSNLDTSMISILIKGSNYSIMGKGELLDRLLTGIFFRTVDIPVHRDNKISAYRAFKAAAEKLKKGASIVMFPEGGISNDYPPAVQEFKNGPFRLAIEQQVFILPVTSINTWKIMWDDGSGYGSKPGICNIFIHKPVTTAGLQIADTENLKNTVHNVIRSKFENS